MAKQNLTYFFLLLVLVVAVIFQQETEHNKFWQGPYLTIETEFVADYSISWPEEECCLCPFNSRSRKNIQPAISQNFYLPALIHSTGRTNHIVTTVWTVSLIRSILCIYRI